MARRRLQNFLYGGPGAGWLGEHDELFTATREQLGPDHPERRYARERQAKPQLSTPREDLPKRALALGGLSKKS